MVSKVKTFGLWLVLSVSSESHYALTTMALSYYKIDQFLIRVVLEDDVRLQTMSAALKSPPELVMKS